MPKSNKTMEDTLKSLVESLSKPPELRFREFNKKRQQTILWCKGCRNDLVASGSFISDDDNGVKYKCINCGRESVWNFDLFPVPVEIIDGNYPTPKEMGIV